MAEFNEFQKEWVAEAKRSETKYPSLQQFLIVVICHIIMAIAGIGTIISVYNVELINLQMSNVIYFCSILTFGLLFINTLFWGFSQLIWIGLVKEKDSLNYPSKENVKSYRDILNLVKGFYGSKSSVWGIVVTKISQILSATFVAGLVLTNHPWIAVLYLCGWAINYGLMWFLGCGMDWFVTSLTPEGLELLEKKEQQFADKLLLEQNTLANFGKIDYPENGQFYFEAMDATGQEKSGTFDADSEEDAINKVRATRYFVTKIKKV